ncbi:CsiV family protein [Salicola sp. Rm-C-2C1-2]|uniref:CsiV family protein n=1 Tax=Salicola sp. Rm-C-2C1-2 TaxID=3141321 RepID=UPI0032E3FA33
MPSRGINALLISMLVLVAAAMPATAAELYRVELLLFERLDGEPEQLPERHQPVALPQTGVPLWMSDGWEKVSETTPDGTRKQNAPLEQSGKQKERIPKILALPPEDLRLNNIARALDNASDYRVLAFTGWQNPFPDGYRTVPLMVDLVVDEESGKRIQGSLQIERRRYLHVEASLYDTRLPEPALDVAPIPRLPIASGLILPLPSFLSPDTPAHRETATWLRQNRRMRSEEVHYLDAPTFGLVVYFQPITIASSGDEEQGSD